MHPHFFVEEVFVGKTFKDFAINPQAGRAKHRCDIPLQTKFSRNIPLNFPLVASNMDTVTGSKMCIAIAREGGIGILPRADHIPIELEAKWVREVKRAENFIIKNPYTIFETQTVGEARQEMKKRGVGTLLVISQDEELVGMITERGITLCLNDSETVNNWMKKRRGGELQFSKKDITSINEAAEELKRRRVNKLPLIDGKSFKIRGLVTVTDIAKLLKSTWANKDEEGRLRVGAAIGATGDFLERSAELIKAGADVIVMDIAHAHNLEVTKEAVENFRKKFGGFELVCGNVATFEGAKFLKDLGVDGVKVGVGSGHGCLTRIKTGVGVPQVQAIRAVWHAVGGRLPIISDGGVRQYGDISKALALGASSIMVGSLLAGTDESPGDFIPNPIAGSKYKVYRGMTSPEAKFESLESPEEIENIEGQDTRVVYKGSAKEIFSGIKEGLQSMISYAGEINLEAARLKISEDPLAYMIPISQAAIEESYER